MGNRRDHALTVNQLIEKLQAIVKERPEAGEDPVLMACEYPGHEYLGEYGVYCGTVQAGAFAPSEIGTIACLNVTRKEIPLEYCVTLYPW